MRPICLELSGDEALVIFEMLARRAEGQGRLEALHEGEGRALDALQVALEPKLAEPFAPDYHDLVKQALTRLAGRS